MRRALLTALVLIAVGAAPAAACCRHEHVIPDGASPGQVPLAIGDSVMVGATDELVARGIEVEAKEGRVTAAGLEILLRRRHEHTLPDVVVFALGTNIPERPGELARVLRIIGPDRRLLLVTPLRSWHEFGAAPIRRIKTLHPDLVTVVEWGATATGNAGWLWPDGTHLRPAGAKAYAQLIAKAL